MFSGLSENKDRGKRETNIMKENFTAEFINPNPKN
jgi:hypothetical protein